MPDGVAVLVDDGDTELAVRASRGLLSEPAGECRVQGTEAARLAGPLGVAHGGEQRNVEVPERQVDLRRERRPAVGDAAAAGASVGGASAGGASAGGCWALRSCGAVAAARRTSGERIAGRRGPRVAVLVGTARALVARTARALVARTARALVARTARASVTRVASAAPRAAGPACRAGRRAGPGSAGLRRGWLLRGFFGGAGGVLGAEAGNAVGGGDQVEQI